MVNDERRRKSATCQVDKHCAAVSVGKEEGTPAFPGGMLVKGVRQ